MDLQYEIIQTWNLSSGLLAQIKFTPAIYPGIGREIIYNDEVYKIKGIDVSCNPLDASIAMSERHSQGIWECLLEKK